MTVIFSNLVIGVVVSAFGNVFELRQVMADAGDDDGENKITSRDIKTCLKEGIRPQGRLRFSAPLFDQISGNTYVTLTRKKVEDEKGGGGQDGSSETSRMGARRLSAVGVGGLSKGDKAMLAQLENELAAQKQELAKSESRNAKLLRAANTALAVRSTEAEIKTEEGTWNVFLDNQGKPYYFCTESGRTVWRHPLEGRKGVTDDTPPPMSPFGAAGTRISL